MNKKLIFLISVIIMVLTIHFTYYKTKTETVLVSGKVFGFNIQNYDEYKNEENASLIPTSFKKVGTMTFKKLNSNNFAALGHSIKEIKTSKEITGECFEVYLDEIEKATKSTTGKINAELNEDKKIGILEENNSHGIFGELYDTNNKDLIEMQTASRYEINKGHAEILINFYGKGTQRYDVEIEKINYLHQNQNIKLKITSEDLIKKTGGIVQGMSGTPIIQNNKIVGAINYVSKNNSCECYGIFIDKLL